MTAATLTGRPAATRTGTRTRGRVVSYERISRFRATVGANSAEVARGVDRQAEDSDRLAAEYGWAVDEHYTDNDRSASEYATKERERFADLLDDVAAGQIAVILVWVLDRIVRDPRDLETLMDLCRAHRVRLIQTASGSEVDPANPESVLHARISGAVAAYEAAKASMRQRRRMESAVAAGTPHGGRRRFGYEPGMTEVREGEAAIIRDLVSRFLAGESLYALAKGLTDAGIPTANGGKWTGPNLRGLLGGPHLAGFRVHQGKVVGKGTWPAILPVETHDHVRALLANPARRPKGSGNARRWLLSGLMVCDTCGAPCRARPATTTAKGHRVPASYYCTTGRHVHRRADLVDRAVEKAVVARLTRHDASGLFVDDTAAAEVIRLREAREALDARMDEYVAAVATMAPAAYAAATNRLQADMDALDVALIGAATEVRQASRVLAGATGPGAAEAWAGWSLARKRSIIAELAEVRLIGGRQGTTPKGTRFNPDDVVLRDPVTGERWA